MSLKLSFDDDIRMLRDSAGGFLANAEPAKALRRHRDARDFDALARGVWDGMAALGLTGTLVPEASGGAGLGFRESVQIAEMMGRSLATGPFLSTAVMAATAIGQGDNDRLKAAILPAIASGDRVLALAGEERSRHQPLAIDTLARRDGDGYRVSGRKVAVIDGNIADRFIVAARDAEAPGELIMLLVDGRSTEVAVTATMGVDSQPLCDVEFRDAPAGADDLLCAPAATAALLDRVYDAGRLHLAAEMLGLAQEAFDRTIDYLKTRVQFGRKIGEFQALQHRAAILFGEIEIARSVVFKTATLHDEGDGRFAAFASLAKARVGEIARHATAEACHMHGGIGMTDDFDLGFYLKRARGAAERLGDTAFHLERYAALHGI
jgi:alkylation response protein AidB-like acyl-CoA dehydrogenase